MFFRSNGDDSSDYDNDSTIDADYDPRKDQNDYDMDMDEEEPEPHEVRQLAVGGGPPVGDQQLEIKGTHLLSVMMFILQPISISGLEKF